MNITYIIGNGFDLNLGMPTSYKYFYDYYLKVKSNNRAVSNFKKAINDDKENWSDLELELGEYSKNFMSIKDVGDVCLDLSKHLEAYLISTEKLSLTISRELKMAFLNSIYNPYNYLNPADRRVCYTYFRTSSMPHLCNFITLNYTHTIEDILNYSAKDVKVDNSLGCSEGKIYHIHRELGKDGIIVGVNDETQLKNEKFKNDLEMRTWLIKPEFNINTGELVDTNCMDLIKHTDLFCLFGVSLGKTDQKWWNLIGQKISNGITKLIYFPHSDIERSDIHQKIIYKSNQKKILMERMNISSERAKTVAGNIFVSIKPNFMRDKDYINILEENHNKVMKELGII